MPGCWRRSRRAGRSRRRRRCRWRSLTAYYALVDLAGPAGRASRCWSTPAAGGVGMAAVQIGPAPGRGGVRDRQPGQVAGAGRAGPGRGADRVLADAGVRGAVPGGDRGARGGCGAELAGRGADRCVAAAAAARAGGSSRWARPTSATRPRSPAGTGVAYRAFDLSEAGPDRLGQMLAEVIGLLAAGDAGRRCRCGLGCAAGAGGVPVHEPGPAYRQARADRSRPGRPRGDGAGHRRDRDWAGWWPGTWPGGPGGGCWPAGGPAAPGAAVLAAGWPGAGSACGGGTAWCRCAGRRGLARCMCPADKRLLAATRRDPTSLCCHRLNRDASRLLPAPGRTGRHRRQPRAAARCGRLAADAAGRGGAGARRPGAWPAGAPADRVVHAAGC